LRTLFILGAPRSGTTLVLRLCQEVFDYRGAPEGHVWQSLEALDDHFRRIECDLAANPPRDVEAFALFRLSRVTRPGGVLMLTIANQHSWERKQKLVSSAELSTAILRFRRFRTRSICPELLRPIALCEGMAELVPNTQPEYSAELGLHRAVPRINCHGA
jgi:hypothetical protein